jgi:gluconate:H+ symporter, GntP family
VLGHVQLVMGSDPVAVRLHLLRSDCNRQADFEESVGAMSVIAIAVTGVGIVLSSILLFRLHPLIALLLGSLFLLAATPTTVRVASDIAKNAVEIHGMSGALIGLKPSVRPGVYVIVREQPDAAQKFEPNQFDNPDNIVSLTLATPQELVAAERANGLSPAGLIWCSVASESAVTISRTDQLIAVGALPSLHESRFAGIGGRLADGFATTFRRLGIPVTMAAIVGICLLESGAAARLVAALMKLFGPRGTAPALTLSGFILGIPVYFDNVFYLLLPLAKAVGRRRPEFYLTAVMAIIVGATMAHSLVPPTPGPLLVASQFDVGIGKMMLGGLVVGGIAAFFGFAYGSLCHRWVHLVPQDHDKQELRDDEVRGTKPIPLWLAALPVAFPIAALGGAEVIKFLAQLDLVSQRWTQLKPYFVTANESVSVFNDPNLIFIATAVLAILVLRYYSNREVVGRSVAKGISDAGTIVLLTCAGGSFGASLQQLGLADAIGSQFSGMTTPWGLLATAFFLTTIIRAAQGSATVAMITSAAIVSPVVKSIELPFDTLYVALAIGCGSKPLPWMNDSGFWQVATMTGMNTSQTLKTFTVALSLMGLAGFAATLLGAWLLPRL